MAKVYQLMADGFEEIEALAPVDILRRGEVDIQMVSITGTELVTSAHGVVIKTDVLFENADLTDADLLILPGGMPGASNLNSHEGVRKALIEQVNKGRKVGAICAAPMVLGSIGVLKGKRATCYPGFEKYLDGAQYTGELVTVDGNIITGEGPTAVLPYAYRLLSILVGEVKTREIEDGMRYTHLMA